MRQLFINNEIADIDSETAIGVDLQAYDMSSPGSRRVTTSNTFTIPKTAKNMRIVGFAGDPQSISNIVYDSLSCDYWIYNKRLIRNGTARVTEVSDRISILAYEKSDIWTSLQEYYWSDFQKDFLTWLQEEKGYPSISSPFVDTFEAFVNQYIETTSGLILPLYVSNLSQYDPDDDEVYVETINKIYLKYNRTISSIVYDGLGGHFCAFIKTIFEFIEEKFNVSFNSQVTFDYNLFNDSIATSMIVAMKNISIQYVDLGSNAYYFTYNDEGQFLPDDTSLDKEDKTVYDLFILFFQRFNALIDNVSLSGQDYKVYRFDDIDNAPIVDLSGNISESPTFKPEIENVKQNNWIKFSSIYDDGPETLNSKKIICYNKNLEVGSSDESLFDIDEYVPDGVASGGNVILNLSENTTLNNFTLMILDSTSASCTVAYMQEGVEESSSVILKVAQLYSLESEYNTYATMIAYPKFFELKRYFTFEEIQNLVFFAKYWIKELNGYFFLQKIESYNPEKSLTATKIELIKIT